MLASVNVLLTINIDRWRLSESAGNATATRRGHRARMYELEDF